MLADGPDLLLPLSVEDPASCLSTLSECSVCRMHDPLAACMILSTWAISAGPLRARMGGSSRHNCILQPLILCDIASWEQTTTTVSNEALLPLSSRRFSPDLRRDKRWCSNEFLMRLRINVHFQNRVRQRGTRNAHGITIYMKCKCKGR
jgi:hypothetical protein